jgi:hypothetical protein
MRAAREPRVWWAAHPRTPSREFFWRTLSRLARRMWRQPSGAATLLLALLAHAHK